MICTFIIPYRLIREIICYFLIKDRPSALDEPLLVSPPPKSNFHKQILKPKILAQGRRSKEDLLTSKQEVQINFFPAIHPEMNSD